MEDFFFKWKMVFCYKVTEMKVWVLIFLGLMHLSAASLEGTYFGSIYPDVYDTVQAGPSLLEFTTKTITKFRDYKPLLFVITDNILNVTTDKFWLSFYITLDEAKKSMSLGVHSQSATPPEPYDEVVKFNSTAFTVKSYDLTHDGKRLALIGNKTYFLLKPGEKVDSPLVGNFTTWSEDVKLWITVTWDGTFNASDAGVAYYSFILQTETPSSTLKFAFKDQTILQKDYYALLRLTYAMSFAVTYRVLIPNKKV